MIATHTLPRAVATYRDRCPLPRPWTITPAPLRRYHFAVVIPALAESTSLFKVLASLGANPPEVLDSTMILVVVNQRTDAAITETSDNQHTLASLAHWQREKGMEHLYWVDAASPGWELPPKQGVGLARKIGMDLALPHLEYGGTDPVIICLDADTLVQPNYLTAIQQHFNHAHCGGASIPYCHRKATTHEQQAAIDRYELFLRVYVLGLKLAGSPYAFHTVGSAMACRTSSYIKAGGMNQRLAGEDFYFLQQIHKTSGVAELHGTIVHPSPRSSHRVPFGTGRSVGDMLTEGEGSLLFYRPELFVLLKQWLATVSCHYQANGATLLSQARELSPMLSDYLHQQHFAKAWDNLVRNTPPNRLLKAFHDWFDAFRTMRLMHHVTDNGFPRVPPEQAVPPLLKQAGLPEATSVPAMLELLRTTHMPDYPCPQ